MNHVNPMRFSDISGNDHRIVSIGFLSAKLIPNEEGGQIRIASVEGAYDRESDEKNWWHWVERNISFKLQVLFVPENTPKTKVSFEYGTRGEQAVLLRIIMRDGRSQEVLLQSNGNALERFDKVFDIPPIELSEIRLETNGVAYPLGNGDPRSAAWIIRNLSISSVFQ